MLYIVGTGCHTNLVSKKIFDCLPKHIQNQCLDCDTHGKMTDGTRLPLHGVVQIPIWITVVKLEEISVASQINEDAAQGMLFLGRPDCEM